MKQYIRELKDGLRDNRYKEVHCKICSNSCGVIPRWCWAMGFVIYCTLCRDEAVGIPRPMFRSEDE